MELSALRGDPVGAERSLMKLGGLRALAAQLGGCLGGRWHTSGTAYSLDM